MYTWKPKQGHVWEVAYQCRSEEGQEAHIQLIGPAHPSNKVSIEERGGKEDTFHLQPNVVVTVPIPFGAEMLFSTSPQNSVNIRFSS